MTGKRELLELKCVVNYNIGVSGIKEKDRDKELGYFLKNFFDQIQGLEDERWVFYLSMIRAMDKLKYHLVLN